MPKANKEKREQIKEWLYENAKPHNQPEWLADIVSAKFQMYYTPLWLDKMAKEAIENAKK